MLRRSIRALLRVLVGRRFEGVLSELMASVSRREMSGGGYLPTYLGKWLWAPAAWGERAAVLEGNGSISYWVQRMMPLFSLCGFCLGRTGF